MGAEGNADDPRPLRDLLEMLSVLASHVGRKDLTGHQFDSIDFGLFRKGTREIENILNLAAGVGVTTQFRLAPADQAVDTDQRNEQLTVADFICV